MPRLLLLLILLIIVARIFSRLVRAFRDGMQQAGGSPHPPAHGVAMVRDPVCGTFVLPERAVALQQGRARMYFCSDACREKYRAQRESVEGRTA